MGLQHYWYPLLLKVLAIRTFPESRLHFEDLGRYFRFLSVLGMFPAIGMKKLIKQ